MSGVYTLGPSLASKLEPHLCQAILNAEKLEKLRVNFQSEHAGWISADQYYSDFKRAKLTVDIVGDAQLVASECRKNLTRAETAYTNELKNQIRDLESKITLVRERMR